MSAKTPTITPGERLPTPDEAHAKQTARDPHNPAVSDDTTPKHVPPATPSAVLLDLKALRLPADYGATYGVRKLLTTVPVGKPRGGDVLPHAPFGRDGVCRLTARPERGA